MAVPAFLDFAIGDDAPTADAGRALLYPDSTGRWVRKGPDGTPVPLEGVPASRQIGTAAGSGLSGGGALNADLALVNADKGSSAVNAHLAAVDPHPQYLLPTEFDDTVHGIRGGGALHAAATTAAAGFLSATDKAKLDGFAPSVTINRQALAAGSTYLAGVPFAALRVGTHLRAILKFSNIATASTTTFVVRLGTAGTTADAAVVTLALAAGTAVADNAQAILDIHVDSLSASAGAITGSVAIAHNTGGVTGFTAAISPIIVGQTVTANTNIGGILGVSITETAAAVTLLHGTLEVIVP